MMEFEDAVSERMAQLEQEDLERYQRDVLRNSSYTYDDETPNYVDEFQSKLSVLLDMVRGLSSDLKRTTSSIENESEPPVINLQPVSFVDVVESCNNSGLRYETTEERLSDEELVLNQSPEPTKMLDFNDNESDETANSDEMHKFAEPVVSESGLHVLSIYCAHMAPKWKSVLDSQPIQGNVTSVEVYFDQFYNWKMRLEAVSYIGDEQSYIDDFLWGLKRDLRMRVWEYNWKPQSLYGAFRRAVIEETMMKKDAEMVLEEMPQLNYADENVLDENVYVVLDASGPLDVKLHLNLSAKSYYFQSIKTQEDVVEASTCLVLDEMVRLNPTYLPLTGKYHDIEVADTKRVDKALKVECLRVSGNLFNELLSTMFMFDPGISPQLDEMIQSFLEAQQKEQVVDLYAYDIKFIMLVLFDPGGGRNGDVSLSIRDTHPLTGKSHEIYVFGSKGVISTHRHANSFLYTSHWNSHQTLFHDMDKYTAVMMILGALKGLEGEMVHMFVFIHPEDVVPAVLSIQRVHFKLAGRALLALSYIEHMTYTLLGNSLSYQNAVVRRITHKDFHLLEQLQVSLMNKFRVLIVTEVSHLSEMFGVTKYYFWLIMQLSMFNTQVVIKKLPTSESKMRIEFEKWHNHLVVENCCCFVDPSGYCLLYTGCENLEFNQRCLYERLQSWTTIIVSHKLIINGVMLVIFVESSVLLSCVAWINTDVVTSITPCVFCAQVSQQLLFSMKACRINALLKGGDSLWEMVDRVIIIQAGLSLSYSFQLAEQVRFYIIMSDMVLSPFYVVLAMLASVVCDTSQDDISLYIIEDNDVLKKKGIGIYLALVQDHILNGAPAHYYYARTWIMARSLVYGEMFSLLIASSIFRIRKSYNLKELLVTFRSVRLDCEDTTDAMRFMNKDIKASPQFGLAFLTLGSEHYIWDPGSSEALMGGYRVDAFYNGTTHGINGRDLCGICMRCKAESLLAIGKYFDTTSILMEVTTLTIFVFETKVVRGRVASLEYRGVFVILPSEKHSIQCYDLLLAFSLRSKKSPIYFQRLGIHEKYNIWAYGEGIYVSTWSLQHCRI